MKIELNHIIKEIVLNNEFANPFSDEFNEKKILLEYKNYIENIYKKYEITSKEKGEEAIDIILELNQIYDFLMVRIEELIDEINLSKFNLIESIISLTNFDYFSLNEMVKKNVLENENKLPNILENEPEQVLENIFGDKVKAQDVVDVSVDICNILFEIILSFNPEYDRDLPTLKKNEEIILIKQLIFTANLFVNIEEAFKYYKFEFGELTKKNDSILFKHVPNIYYHQQIIGKQRFTNLIHESYFYGSKYFKEKRTNPLLAVENSSIVISKGENETDSDSEIWKNSLFITFYFHLQNKKLKYFENITIIELIDILFELQALFHNLKHEEITSQAVKYQDYRFIPIKIKKTSLIEHLVKTTKLKKNIIIKVFNKLTSGLNNPLDIWKTPLINIDDNYYFIAPSVAKSNLAYLIDNIIEKTLPLNIQESAFRFFVQNEFSTKLESGYKFELLDVKKIDKKISDLANTIIIQTKSNIIIFEICLYKFPLQSEEYNIAIQRLGDASERLNRKKELITKNIDYITEDKDVKIYGIVLTNYTSLSGLYLNCNHVLDLYLVKNYFFSGELRQGKVVFGHDNIQTQEMAALKYYSTESEFNDNLKDFLFKPNPIFDKLQNYITNEYPIVPKEMQPQIFRDGIESITLTSRIWEQLKEVEYYFNQLYYFEKNYEDDTHQKKYIENKITYYLPQIFNLIAFEQDRTVRIGVINKIESGNLQSLPYLIFVMQNTITLLQKIKITKNIKRDHREYSVGIVQELLQTLYKNNHIQDTVINFSNFTLKHDYKEETLKDILEYITSLLATLSQKKYSEEELNNYLILISFFVSLTKGKPEYKKELYTIFLIFTDTLNFNNYFQKARDFSEGVLDFSLKEEDIPVIGWLCLFKCYIKQNNLFDALFYGNLFFSALTTLPEIDKFLIIDALYNSLLFFRNFGFSDAVENLYEILKQIQLNEYDRQKVTLSYFNAQLQMNLEKINTLVSDIDRFLSENIEKITYYKEKGAIPWVALLMNIENLYKHGVIENFSPFKKHLKNLKLVILKDSLNDLELKFKPHATKSKELLKNTLIKVFETRDFEDLASELSELEILAKNVIKVSLSPLDIDSLLLAGLIINDHSLTFRSKQALDYAPFFPNNTELEKEILNYSKSTLNKLVINENQLIVWIFEVDRKVYVLSINHKKKYFLKKLDNWDYSLMRDWLSNLSKFFFDDKIGGLSINEQEQEYIKTLRETKFSVIPEIKSGQEILVYSSLRLSEFPHNLLQFDNEEGYSSLSNHQEIVQEYLKNNPDFISFNTSITNIVSIDWYTENGNDIHLSTDNFKIEAWIPIDEEPDQQTNDGFGIDMSVYTGYAKLKPIIEHDYNGIIYTDIFPKKKLSSNINLFLAHGGKGLGGFTTIYSKQVNGKAIAKQRGIEEILGIGLVAILFVCHSASISKEIYAQKLNSFINLVLSRGYKAVIAPAWALNPEITSIWLSGFLEKFKTGVSLGQSVFFANQKVATEGYDEYFGFYSPTGWASMHLYGNPNIYFKN